MAIVPRALGFWILAVLGLAIPVAAQESSPPTSNPSSRKAMYEEWCAVCHGEDGRGRPPEPRVKTVPMDFTDCRLTTAETDADWSLVTTHGGTTAGRSSEMPGFEMLPAAAIREILRHVRSFCSDPGWPNGNLNFPRSLVAVKAFPESEVFVGVGLSHGRDTNPRGHLDISYATRLGRRGQFEVTLPAQTVTFAGRRAAGVGDVALEGKYVLRDVARKGAIVSAGLELRFPTGSARWQFGEGTAEFEPFLAVGVARGDWFFQGDIRALLPVTRFPGEPAHYTAFNVSALRPLTAQPTAWTFGLGATGIDGSLSIGPEFLKGLTRTGSFTLGGGVEVPIRPVSPAAYGTTRWSTYLLWDYMEPFRSRP
jgi:mono/diheme cytochrome c family protein